MSARLLFRCDSGGAAGVGHFTRSLALARTVREIEPRASLRFWGRFDAFACSLLARYGVERVDAPCGGFAGADAALADRVSADDDVLVLDSYEIQQSYVDRLSGRRCRLALLDDEHRLDLHAADLVACFRVDAERQPYGARREALGLGYLLAKPELRALRLANLDRATAPVRRILVFLGGGDLDPALPRSLLAALRLPGIELAYLGREPVADADGVAMRALGPDVEQAFADADLVVCGGGLVKYECAYAGIANACLSRTSLQAADTARMAAHGFTLDLGPADDFDAAAVGRQISAFIADPGALAGQRRAFRDMLDTDSPRRLARCLLTP